LPKFETVHSALLAIPWKREREGENYVCQKVIDPAIGGQTETEKRNKKERKETGRGIFTKSCEYGLKHTWDRYDQHNATKENEIIDGKRLFVTKITICS